MKRALNEKPLENSHCFGREMLCFLCVIFLSVRRGERKCYRSARLTKKGGAREYWICVWTIHLRIGFGDEGKKERLKGKL